MSLNLYRVEMSGGKMFFVVAKDEAVAARAAERQWESWGYFRSEGSAISTDLIAGGKQYPPKGVAWLLGPPDFLTTNEKS